MVSLLPGGRMAELWSAKWVMNGSILLNLVASLLTPVTAQIHYSFFIVMRFVQGVGGVSDNTLDIWTVLIFQCAIVTSLDYRVSRSPVCISWLPSGRHRTKETSSRRSFMRVKTLRKLQTCVVQVPGICHTLHRRVSSSLICPSISDSLINSKSVLVRRKLSRGLWFLFTQVTHSDSWNFADK